MATSEIRVRLGGWHDIPFLVLSAVSMLSETEGRELSGDVVRAGVESIFSDPARGFYVVAELDEQAIGSLLVAPLWLDLVGGCHWWIHCVYVSPGYRRRGVFEAMYEFVKSEASGNHSVAGIRLCVLGSNQAACEAYRGVGMEELPYVMFQQRLKK